MFDAALMWLFWESEGALQQFLYHGVGV